MLSERYIQDRFLPDKAIDLLDEACACTCIRTPELAEYDEKTKKLKVLEDMEKSIEEQSELIMKLLQRSRETLSE